MKIKTKKQLNLPQLIEWGFKNDITNQFYRANDTKGYISEVFFSEIGLPHFSSMVDKQDTFTVEVEEEIAEDTKFDIIVLIEKDSCSATWANNSINKLKDNRSKEFHAYIDGEFKCIWKKGKLVE